MYIKYEQKNCHLQVVTNLLSTCLHPPTPLQQVYVWILSINLILKRAHIGDVSFEGGSLHTVAVTPSSSYCVCTK